MDHVRTICIVKTQEESLQVNFSLLNLCIFKPVSVCKAGPGGISETPGFRLTDLLRIQQAITDESRIIKIWFTIGGKPVTISNAHP